MLDSAVGELIEPRKLIVASPGTSVKEAARLMRSRKVGAVLVVRDEQLVGIFTERDALTRVMAERRDPAATRLALAEAMTTRDTVAGRTTYLFHEDRQLLRQLANRRGYHVFQHVPASSV